MKGILNMSLKTYAIVISLSLFIGACLTLIYWLYPSAAVRSGGYMICAWTLWFIICGYAYIED